MAVFSVYMFSLCGYRWSFSKGNSVLEEESRRFIFSSIHQACGAKVRLVLQRGSFCRAVSTLGMQENNSRQLWKQPTRCAHAPVQHSLYFASLFTLITKNSLHLSEMYHQDLCKRHNHLFRNVITAIALFYFLSGSYANPFAKTSLPHGCLCE